MATTATASGGSTTATTRGGDNYRTGWYPDQTALTPSVVKGGTFGRLFKTPVTGSVYGQPLLDDNQLLVTTEDNYAYGLDPVTGAIEWQTPQFGAPVQNSVIGCSDLGPDMGITSTPVVDPATSTEYLVDNQYVSGTTGTTAYYMHALNLANNGTEQPGFPVQIAGTAQNVPSQTFNPYYELQRPGLLLLDGVVYASFGAHCDITPYQGWIAGVSEAGTLTTMWTSTAAGTSGAGIWMSGGGLVSDGPGQILFATGNGSSNSGSPIPGSSPPASLGESVVRLAVQPNGTLKAVDFFAPYDSTTLDQGDIDFGSGSPVALPDSYFGTAAIPHLAVEAGKEGYVYLLNRDNLGGFDQGPNQSDNVVGRYGPNGGVWSSPAVWPGDGGWIYLPTSSGSGGSGETSGVMDAYHYGVDGTGKPALSLVGSTAEAFGFSSSAPVVTSNGSSSGTALLWAVRSPDASGVGATLEAYNPIPVGGALQQVFSAPIGTSSKFNPPGVGGNRIYVGTRDGNVIGFGSPVTVPVSAPSPTFPATVVGSSSTQTVTVTANTAVTVTSLSVTGAFSLGNPSIALPASLATGHTVTVPVTFTPTHPGPAGGGITITTAASGTVQVTLNANGQSNGANLSSTTNGLSFEGVTPSSQSSDTVSFTNLGSQALTISAVDLPGSPFSTSGAPAVGHVMQPGDSLTVTVTFGPTRTGQYSAALQIDSDGGNITVHLTGNSTSPSVLAVTPLSVDYGTVRLGQSRTQTFRLTDVGASSLTVTKSKSPSKGPFKPSTTLAEGTTMTPGSTVVESVTFTPTAVGTTTDQWLINSTDGKGVRSVVLTGTGATSVATLTQPIEGMASTPDGKGYWVTDGSGGIRARGDAGFFGSMAGQHLNAPIAHIVATPDGNGYWLVAADGGTFGFGDARFYGSMGGATLNASIVDMAPTKSGNGYWLVAADGGIFAFGDARFHGSMGGQHLNEPIVGIASDPATGGYWEVASDGGIFAFDAPFYGSTGTVILNKPVNGMASTSDGKGYWFVASDGGIFAFGDAHFHGSAGGLTLVAPVVGMAADPTTSGYWFVASDGGIFSYASPFYGPGTG